MCQFIMNIDIFVIIYQFLTGKSSIVKLSWFLTDKKLVRQSA